VREFMRFVLSREGQEIIAKNGPYSPLPAEYLRAQLKKLEAGAGDHLRGAPRHPVRASSPPSASLLSLDE
jgi:ABC-type Fe3+ transport system substrate-binding protein